MDITAKRKEALQEIGGKRVTFDYRSAAWQLDDVPQGGWKGRTYAQLWRDGYVNRPEQKGKATVVRVGLTRSGRDALRQAGG